MDQVSSGKRYPFTIIKICFIDHYRSPLRLGSLCAIRCSNESSLAQVVLGFEILDFGGIRTIQDPHRDGKHGISLALN